IADPVGLEGGLAALGDFKPQLVDGPFDATAGHAADDLVVPGAGDGHRRTRVPGRATVGAHHRGPAEGLAGLPPRGAREKVAPPPPPGGVRVKNTPHLKPPPSKEAPWAGRRWPTSAGMAA